MDSILPDEELHEADSAAAGEATGKRRVNVLMNSIVVGIGGFIGANARYWAGEWAGHRWGKSFPYGTVLINVLGCFILGLFATLAARLAWNEQWRLLVAVGFVGAFTTFSTYEYETFQLVEQGSLLRAGLNLVVSLLAGFAAVLIGVGVGRLLLHGKG